MFNELTNISVFPFHVHKNIDRLKAVTLGSFCLVLPAVFLITFCIALLIASFVLLFLLITSPIYGLFMFFAGLFGAACTDSDVEKTKRLFLETEKEKGISRKKIPND